MTAAAQSQPRLREAASEADSGRCFVKFGAARPGTGAEQRFAGQNAPLPRRAVRFESTAPDGAARAGGLTSDDTIVAVDGIAVCGVDELHRLMTEERIGKPVPITVLRLSQNLDITITPRESPPRPAA